MAEAGTSEMITNTFPSRKALDAQLAADVAAALENAVATRGHALLAVSGGSTPIGFFHLLSQQDIPWSKVTITLVDERWVEPDHTDSNEKRVRECLLINAAAQADFIPLKNNAESVVAGQAQLEQVLSRLGTLDVLVLGMGADGHTASLFPQAESLAEALDQDSGKSCIAIDPVTTSHQRMTMTLPRLLDARQIYIHITGDEKKAVLEKARRATDPALLPISAIIRQQRVPVTLYWAK